MFTKFDVGNVVVNTLTNKECVIYKILSDDLVCIYTVVEDTGTVDLVPVNCLAPKQCSRSTTGYCSYKAIVPTIWSVKDICRKCELFNS